MTIRVTDFARRVTAQVKRIPPGRVASYGDIARAAGRPGAARAVGNIMRDCSDPLVPCHRVVHGDGRVHGYGGHDHIKRMLLRAEGLTIPARHIRRFARVRWRPK